MLNIYRMLFFSFEEGKNGRSHPSSDTHDPINNYPKQFFPFSSIGEGYCAHTLNPIWKTLLAYHQRSHCVYFPQFWTVDPAIRAWNYRPRVAFSGLPHCNRIWRILVQIPKGTWLCLGQCVLVCSYPTSLQSSWQPTSQECQNAVINIG